MTIQELEEFFQNTEVPKNTMLNQATKITDPEVFITTNIPRLKTWKGDVEQCPSYWHLMELVKVLA